MTNPINGALPPPPKQIRFVNNQGQPPSKRRRINAAYVPSASCISTLLHPTRSGAAITVAGIVGCPPAYRRGLRNARVSACQY
jgi:hypothetical protein